jgi:hypothetical protein
LTRHFNTGPNRTVEYLSYLFEQLPSATTVEAIEALLPWNLKLVLDARRER